MFTAIISFIELYSGGKINQKHLMTTGLMKSTLLVKFGVIEYYYHGKIIIQQKNNKIKNEFKQKFKPF